MNTTKLTKTTFDYIKNHKQHISSIEYISESFIKFGSGQYKSAPSSLVISVYNGAGGAISLYSLSSMPSYRQDGIWFNEFLELIEDSIEMPIENFTNNKFHYLTDNEMASLPNNIAMSLDAISELVKNGMISKQYFAENYMMDYNNDMFYDDKKSESFFNFYKDSRTKYNKDYDYLWNRK